MYHSRPLSDVVAVITAAELADFSGIDVSDPLLDVFATTATAAVIEFIQSELIERGRVAVYETWPTVGTASGANLSPSDARLVSRIELPYARLIGTPTVHTAGELTEDFTTLDARPAALSFATIPFFVAEGEPALKIQYRAGFGPSRSDVPEVIRTAVTMLADFLYNNRGACSADDALKKSGAATILGPYRANVVIL